jgi:hypothetical protein
MRTSDAPFELGHTEDRVGWTGSEHLACNRRAGARFGNAKRRGTAQPGALRTSRAWGLMAEWVTPKLEFSEDPLSVSDAAATWTDVTHTYSERNGCGRAAAG